MFSITLFYILMSSLFVTLILIPPIAHLAVKFNKIDIPDERKVHNGKIPRLAGIAIFLAFLFTTLLFCDINRPLRGFLLGGVIIFSIGLYDDLIGIRPRWKLLGEVFAALMVVLIGNVALHNLGNLFGTGIIQLGIFAIPFTVFGIVGVTNAINLLDGLDGLAGGISAIAAIALALLAYMVVNFQLLALVVALIGAIFGFLKFNTYPARIFMGDSGSLFIGYCLASFSVMLCSGEGNRISEVTPLIILLVPIIDTLIVMLTRLRCGKPLSSPDNNHIHHRLMVNGFSHKTTVIIIYLLSYATALIGLTTVRLDDVQLLILIVPIAFFLIVLHHYINPLMLERFTYLKSDDALRQTFVYKVLSRYMHEALSVLKYLTFGLPALCLFIPAGNLSKESASTSALLLILTLFLIILTRDWGNRFLHLVVYLDGAVLIFLIENYGRDSSLADLVSINILSNGLFFILMLCCGLKLYVERRTRGLMQSPLEYLLFLSVVTIPFLPEEFIRSYHLLTVGAKAVILFTTYRIVLIHKGRRSRWIITATLLALLTVAVKGFF